MSSLKSPLPFVAVGIFLTAHIVVPLVWGDLYPFTSAPMFRDSPTQYCNYHVFAPDGSELPQEDWLVQRVYDGNPFGYGVGITPPAVIEQEFGAVHDGATVRAHLERQFTTVRNREYDLVDVQQEVFGPNDEGSIERMSVTRWHVHSSRDNPAGGQSTDRRVE
jgi:hypothetical protein